MKLATQILLVPPVKNCFPQGCPLPTPHPKDPKMSCSAGVSSPPECHWDLQHRLVSFGTTNGSGFQPDTSGRPHDRFDSKAQLLWHPSCLGLPDVPARSVFGPPPVDKPIPCTNMPNASSDRGPVCNVSLETLHFLQDFRCQIGLWI